MLNRIRKCVAGLAILGTALAAHGQAQVNEIKVGHMHASTGAFAGISMPSFMGLKLWVQEVNAAGGVFVKAAGKKVPVRLISYDDQSNPATVATLTNQLITQDKVDILLSDAGSVLTGMSAPIARDNKMLLFNTSGTGAAYFSKDNQYMVLVSDPVSTVWPKPVVEYLANEAAKKGIKRIALLYSTNDFTGSLANEFRQQLKAAKVPVEIVYDQGVPTNTSTYSVPLNNIAQTKPDALVAFGYPSNDIALLRNIQDSGQTFKMVFAIYPGLEFDTLLKNVGVEGLKDVFTYVTPAHLSYKPDVGMPLEQFRQAWDKAYAASGVGFGWNSIMGYTTGLVVAQTLGAANSLDQLELRRAVFSLSGKLRTLDGEFVLREDGAQLGELPVVGQIRSDGKGGVRLEAISAK